MMRKPVGRLASLCGLLATVSLTLGCGASFDTTSPRSAREQAATAAKNGEARGIPVGAVDCRRAKCVALTFDAGPSENTARLLDILKKERVHATFFMLGRNHVMKYPDLVRRIDAEGHELANHTWTHRILTTIEPAEARKELSLTQDAIQKITGKRPLLMRPPQGRTDEEVSKTSKDLGLAQVLWSVTAKDYQTTDPALIESRVLDRTEPDGIILLHDIYRGTVPAVPGIIAGLKRRGYTVVTVSELLAPAKPEPGIVYRP